jgi:copper(I)-binding protein
MSSLSAVRSRAVRATGLGAALLVGLAACGTSNADTAEVAPTEPAVEVSDAWVRATVGAEDPSMTGAFMTIDNAGEEDVTLTGAISPIAGTAEIHEMAMVDGSMVMRRVEGGLTIEAGYGQVLMPGGNHVMLMGLTEELAPGDEVELTLEFSDGSTEELTAPVKAFTEEEGHYHESDAPHSHPSGSPAGSMQPLSPSGSAKP